MRQISEKSKGKNRFYILYKSTSVFKFFLQHGETQLRNNKGCMMDIVHALMTVPNVIQPTYI